MYGELTFLSNQEYAYSQNSDKCAAFTLLGYYQVQRGILTMHWVQCTFACLPGTDYARISFISANVLKLVYAGRTFLYYRQ